MDLEASLPPTAIRLQQTGRKYALCTMTLPEQHPIRLRTSTTFPPEFSTSIETDIPQSDWDSMNSKHSQLWRIHNSIAIQTPSTTRLEEFNHTANPPWFNPTDPNRVSINIPWQKKEELAETRTNLTNVLINDPEHLVINTDGSQTREGLSGTGLAAIHALHPHYEAYRNLGRYVEVYDTELFGILPATRYSRQWIENNPHTNTVWIFIDKQVAIRRCTKPHPTPGQHISLQIIENLQNILNTRPNTRVNIQWVFGHSGILGNKIADRCAREAIAHQQRSRQSFTSVAFIWRQIQYAGLREWQNIWQACSSGAVYSTTAQGILLWGPTWKPTKLPKTNQMTASTIHQLRLGHGYFRSFLIHLPNYDSSRCHCSEPVPTPKHLLLGCPLYREEREKAGIQRDTTLQGLLFTPQGNISLIKTTHRGQPPSQNPVFEISQPHHQLTPNFRSTIFTTPSNPY